MLNILISIDRSKPRIYTSLTMQKIWLVVLRCHELKIESPKYYMINSSEVHNYSLV